jgi:hypothetical protein
MVISALDRTASWSKRTAGRLPCSSSVWALDQKRGQSRINLTDKTSLGEAFDQLRGVTGLPNYEISDIDMKGVEVRITARYNGPLLCPHCGGSRLRSKDRFTRRVRHEDWGTRHCVLLLEGRK